MSSFFLISGSDQKKPGTNSALSMEITHDFKIVDISTKYSGFFYFKPYFFLDRVSHL